MVKITVRQLDHGRLTCVQVLPVRADPNHADLATRINEPFTVPSIAQRLDYPGRVRWWTVATHDRLSNISRRAITVNPRDKRNRAAVWGPLRRGNPTRARGQPDRFPTRHIHDIELGLFGSQTSEVRAVALGDERNPAPVW